MGVIARLLRTPWPWLLAALGAVLWAWSAAGGSFVSLWLTPDQQGEWLARRHRYEEAAERFRDPMRRGVALYRAGRFKEAAAAFGRVDGARAAYDRGNALVMAGKYADAIASYDRALGRRPHWHQAQANRELADARRRMLEPTADGAEDTGQSDADEIVFDDRAKQPGAKTAEIASGGALTDDQVQALWVRRVQTKPADFLRAKFAYQLSRRSGEPGQ